MSNGGDRIDWIFDSDQTVSLRERYDAWAGTYDADHDQWGWRGPDLVAAAALRHIEGQPDRHGPNRASPATDTIIDAGCGTGKAGVALRKAGWHGRLIGIDLSVGMLGQAAKSGAYDDLVACSIYELPLGIGRVVATVSSGVFTLGHVGGTAFAELCRITRPGGIVATTMRLDLAAEFASHIDALSASGRWSEIDRLTPQRFHPDRDESEQTVITWRVAES